MAQFAVVRYGTHQYKVETGMRVALDFVRDAKVDGTITFDEVLLKVDGDKVELGQPTIKGATVTAKVLEVEKKGEKLRVVKFKAKKRQKRTIGFRAKSTIVEITKI